MKQCQKCGNTFEDLERDSEEEVSALMKMFEDMLNE